MVMVYPTMVAMCAAMVAECPAMVTVPAIVAVC
jgi:hypothetical protein